MGSIFGLKFKIGELKVEVKEHEWQVSYPATNRREKICAICGYKNSPGARNERRMATFTKRKNVGHKNQFETYYTCTSKGTSCTQHMAQKLNIKL